jgi:hypothetical protein
MFGQALGRGCFMAGRLLDRDLASQDELHGGAGLFAGLQHSFGIILENLQPGLNVGGRVLHGLGAVQGAQPAEVGGAHLRSQLFPASDFLAHMVPCHLRAGQPGPASSPVGQLVEGHGVVSGKALELLQT